MTETSRKILILSTSVGAGHRRAAEAVELALTETAPDAAVANLDVLELTNATFRRLYKKAYMDLAERAPHVVGYLYDLLDRPRSARSKSDRLRVLVEKLNLRPFLSLLKREPWDVIVNTHFLPAEIIASLRRKGKISTPHITVTTDFDAHRLWAARPCDRHCAATEDGAASLEGWGVPAGDISVTGIPIHPAFSRPGSREACLASQGLAGESPIVLQLAGGFGLGPIEKIYGGLLRVASPLEIVVVAGRNEEARARLAKIEAPSRHRVKLLGFTDTIHELMALADVIVSKPGGLTSSEALASGAAMAVVNPIPGQESRNSDFLLENGAAIKINNIAALPRKLSELLADKDRLSRLKRNAARLGKPRAAFDVAQIALGLVAGHRAV
ncbi:MAG: glycosyltransferase [Elusimicrobiota bacterium]